MHRLAGRLALLYLLTSTYLVARLLSNRFLIGTGGVDIEFLVETVAVSLAQFGVVQLLRLGGGTKRERRAGAGGGPEAGRA